MFYRAPLKLIQWYFIWILLISTNILSNLILPQYISFCLNMSSFFLMVQIFKPTIEPNPFLKKKRSKIWINPANSDSLTIFLCKTYMCEGPHIYYLLGRSEKPLHWSVWYLQTSWSNMRFLRLGFQIVLKHFVVRHTVFLYNKHWVNFSSPRKSKTVWMKPSPGESLS